MENTVNTTTGTVNSQGAVISLSSNENVNLTGAITCTENGNSTQVVFMSSNLNADTFALNINVTVANKDLYKKYGKEVRAKYQEFKDNVEKRATDLGYVLF